MPPSNIREVVSVSIQYKIDVVAALKEAGYAPTRIKKEKLLGESYMTQLRRGELVSWAAMNTICRLLQCQPGDILEYQEETRGAE